MSERDRAEKNPARARGVLIAGSFLSASTHNRFNCEELAEHLEHNGWRVFTTSRQPRRFARLADMLFTAWRRRAGYQVARVDVYSGRALTLAEIICRWLCLLGKPYVLCLQGGNLGDEGDRMPERMTRLLRSAGAVTTPSRYLQQRLRRFRPDIQRLANPIETRQYPFAPRNRPRPRLIWVRAFQQVYNPVMVPEVVARLQAELPQLQVIMLGPDRHDGSLERTRRRAEELGVAECISFPGGVHKSEVAGWLGKADIFLNTTRVESFGLSVMEAAACGLCIVTTAVGELPFLWQDGKDALLVPDNDAAAMARAVRRLLDEPDLAGHLSYSARVKAEEYSWPSVLPEWQELLERVAAQGRAGRKH